MSDQAEVERLIALNAVYTAAHDAKDAGLSIDTVLEAIESVYGRWH